MLPEFHDLLFTRRSIRRYTTEEISPDDVKTLIEAALLAPSSKSSRPWQFTVVDNRELLQALSECKPLYAHPIANSALSVVVSANPEESDVWIEDASIAAAYVQLQAEALGLGSCWIQIRNRMHDDDNTASEWIKDLLAIDGSQQVLCVISIGHKDEERKPVDPEKLRWDKVHINHWEEMAL